MKGNRLAMQRSQALKGGDYYFLPESHSHYVQSLGHIKLS